MHAYTLVELKLNWVTHSRIKTPRLFNLVALSVHVRIGIGLCVLCMLEIFSGGHELEVEGDESRCCRRRKTRNCDLFKKVAQKMEEVGVVPM